MSEILNQMGSHYPKTWKEYIGQEDAVRQLQIAAKSARARKTPMRHVFITGKPGQGKTSLAMLIAKELGGNLRIETEPIKPAQAPFVLMDMKDGDVLFLDEAHKQAQGGKQNIEWLYHLLENGVITGKLGSEPAPKVTVVAATTDAGRLPPPFLDRFDHQVTLMPYTDAEGTQLARQLAVKTLVTEGLPLPNAAVCAAIARAGNNSPRHIRNILAAVRDLATTDQITPKRGAYDLTEALRFAGVTPDGLHKDAQQYLRVLFKEFRGDPAGQRTMADRLNQVGSGIKELEQVLLDKGFIALTKTGRMLTPDGMRRARDLVAP